MRKRPSLPGGLLSYSAHFPVSAGSSYMGAIDKCPGRRRDTANVISNPGAAAAKATIFLCKA